MANAPLSAQSMFDLTGMVAIVTGGGTGIGLMIAKGLASNGAKTYITGRREDVLKKLADDFGKENPGAAGSIIPLSMDVTNKESIMAGRRVIEEKEGKLHILVNNAGQTGPNSPWLGKPDSPELKDGDSIGKALFNEDMAAWGDHYNVNVFSIFFVTSAFLGLLERGSDDFGPTFTSSVINTTSISGIIKVAQDHFCYNSAKAAASHLTKMMSTEFALKKVPVRVNAVAPGVYASEMTLDEITADKVDKVGKGLQPVPAARAGTDVEMAGTVLYLASRAGCYANGQEIVIDGGYCAVNPATK
ncbi:short-chain dehydrogenase [Dendrothele bispora CBS 962.96]|uniref:Short-chain dehydrogenase n=1 Tax=Dendrothele bispora (strain CBS 962.96) TaxID=1314807 RepID=A0A4S8MQV3_DENBC|nr:short-chain dehydrogenase [Dendrothele bispora CBS 962.96]